MTERNTGMMTVVTIGEQQYEVDGYITKDIFKSICSFRTMQTLDWTNLIVESKLVLSESNFIEANNGDIFTIEFVDIDSTEKRKFASQAKVGRLIEEFISKYC